MNAQSACLAEVFRLLRLVCLTTLFTLGIFPAIFSQEKVEKPLEIGKEYIVLTEEGKVAQGTLVIVRKESITIRTKMGDSIIDRSRIEEILPVKERDEDRRRKAK